MIFNYTHLKGFIMSISINGKNAKIHVFSTEEFTGTLKPSQAMLYLTPFKLGKISRNSSAGLTPDRAFRERYRNQRSSMSENLIASDFYVIDKKFGEEYDYDEGFRFFVHQQYKAGKIPFDALYKGYQKAGHNAEALCNFVRDRDIDTLTELVKNHCGLSGSFNSKESISWRYMQKEDAIEIVDILQKNSICLYAAHTARGKTKIASEVAARLLPKGGIVLVTTPITDTKKSFEDNVMNYHFGDDRTLNAMYLDNVAFEKYTVPELRVLANNGTLVYVVLTVQDARYNDFSDMDSTAVRDKYSDLSGNIDLWIRDERHFQYNGDITSQRLENLDAAYYLDLTATPYNVIDKYDTDTMLTRTLLWGLQHKDFTHLPSIRISAVNTPFVNVSSSISHLFHTHEGFTPIKLFHRENDKFTMQSDIVEVFDRFYHSTLSRTKNPLSIVNDTEISDVSKQCGLVVLPAGSGQDSADRYIPALANLLNQTSKTFFIDSYTIEKQCPRDTAIGDYIEDLISQYGRVVILTCGKFLTGTDIPALGHVILFDKMGSLANFEQLLGRMIRFYPGKNEVKLYSLAPGTSTKITLGRLAKTNEFLSNSNPVSFLDCVPFSEYEHDQFVNVSATDIIQAAQNWCRQQINRTLPTETLKKALMNVDRNIYENLNILRSKVESNSEKITDDNDASSTVTEKSSKTKNPCLDEDKHTLDCIAETIQEMQNEATWIAHSLDNYDFMNVYSSNMMNLLFGQKNVDIVIEIFKNSEKLANIIRTDLVNKHQAFRDLPARESYPHIFINSENKQKHGIVYVDFDLADELCAELQSIYKYDESFSVCVHNALNGAIPLVIKEKFPNASITCNEPFPYFINHLVGLGFNVINKNKLYKTHMNKEVHMSKFSIHIGNPPYQVPDNGFGASATPIYHKFVNQAIDDDPEHILMVIPARWLSGGRSELNAFRKSMLSDKRINLLHDYHSSKELFKNVEVKGGICYFRWDRDTPSDNCRIVEHYSNGKTTEIDRPLLVNGLDTFVRINEAFSILDKVSAFGEPTMDTMVMSSNMFSLGTNYAFFTTTETPTTVTLYRRGSVDFIEMANIKRSAELIGKHKVLIPNVFGSGNALVDVIKPIYAKPNTCCTATYVIAGAFDTEEEAQNLISYINTKFFHFLLTLKKNTHHATKGEYKFIPIQDFSKPWTDEELFVKYQLSPQDITDLLGSVR